VTEDRRNVPISQAVDQSTAVELQPLHSSPSQKAYARYCVTIALVPVIAVVCSVFIARSSWYLRHQRNSYLAISDYPFSLINRNCDVIIYGDSSALTGVSPLVIESATGLRTCNIAQPNTALAIAGTFALDSYLQNNSRPKFLIFQFTAPDFSPMNSNGRLYEEGALQLIRHKLDLQTFQFFARHPMQALGFSEFILRTALIEKDWAGGTYDRAWAEVSATHGLFTAPSAPLAHCLGDLEERSPDPRWIRDLRRKYSVGGTRVLFYVAPHPECDNSYDFYTEKIAPLADNRLQRFSIGLFNEKNHFTREGANLNSAHIAADIARILHE
jgi:hypothetical protein